MALHQLGSGRPIVLVHGLMGGRDTWREVGERLVTAGYRVVVPELIGFGQSDRVAGIDDLWLDAQARALHAALGARLPDGALFVGHDYGGPTIVELFRRAPHLVRGIVVISCNLTADTPVPFPLSSWSWPLLGNTMRRLVLSRHAMALTMRLAVERPAALPVSLYLGDERQFAAIQTIFTHAIRELSARYGSVHATLPTIDVPTIVVWGDGDPFFSVAEGRRMAALIPDASFVVLPECGHFAPEEQPAAVADVILRMQRSGEAASRPAVDQA